MTCVLCSVGGSLVVSSGTITGLFTFSGSGTLALTSVTASSGATIQMMGSASLYGTITPATATSNLTVIGPVTPSQSLTLALGPCSTLVPSCLFAAPSSVSIPGNSVFQVSGGYVIDTGVAVTGAGASALSFDVRFSCLSSDPAFHHRPPLHDRQVYHSRSQQYDCTNLIL